MPFKRNPVLCKTLTKGINCSLCLCHWGCTPSLVVVIILHFILYFWWSLIVKFGFLEEDFVELGNDCGLHFFHHFSWYSKAAYSIAKLNICRLIVTVHYDSREYTESWYMTCHAFTRTIKHFSANYTILKMTL